MRPRHKAAENGRRRMVGSRRMVASMRPRHKAAENASMSRGTRFASLSLQ